MSGKSYECKAVRCSCSKALQDPKKSQIIPGLIFCENCYHVIKYKKEEEDFKPPPPKVKIKRKNSKKAKS